MGAILWNPELIYYACIAKSTTILAHHHNVSKDRTDIEALASECVAHAPPNHSLFSHTVNNRTYTFLIDPPFIYFAIVDQQLLKSQTLSFLNHIRSCLQQALASSDHFAPFCLQPQFDSVFADAVRFDAQSPNSVKRSAPTLPLLEKPVEGLKKKKRVVDSNGTAFMDGKDAASAAAMVDVSDDVVAAKVAINDRQKAKHIWKKHVWVVLVLDLFVCAVLFVIWLWVCSGFKCMAY